MLNLNIKKIIKRDAVFFDTLSGTVIQSYVLMSNYLAEFFNFSISDKTKKLPAKQTNIMAS